MQVEQRTGTAVDTRTRKPPLTIFYDQLSARMPEIAKSLPSHIPPEYFERAAKTAVSRNPKLLEVTPRSLFNELSRCAHDGLVPDGKQAVITIYKSKDGEIAVYQPMIAGIRRLVQQSGEITRFEQTIVYKHDTFDFRLGDRPGIYHKPYLDGPRGDPILVYSVAQFRDGTLSREIMTHEEIEYTRRNASRAADGDAWRKWWGEMARKTVAKRHAKVLPMSNDVAAVIDRSIGGGDDEGYRSEAAAIAGNYVAAEAGRPGITAEFDRLASEHGEATSPDRSVQESEPRRKPGRPRGSGRKAASPAVATAADADEPGDGPVIEGGSADWPEGDQPAGDAGPGIDQSTGEVIDTAAAETAPAANVGDRASGTGRAPPADPERDLGDYGRGWRDARAGWSKCNSSAILNDPERLEQWAAGWHAFQDQQQGGDQPGGDKQ
jgi:recombination protein RecT